MTAVRELHRSVAERADAKFVERTHKIDFLAETLSGKPIRVEICVSWRHVDSVRTRVLLDMMAPPLAYWTTRFGQSGRAWYAAEVRNDAASTVKQAIVYDWRNRLKSDIRNEDVPITVRNRLKSGIRNEDVPITVHIRVCK